MCGTATAPATLQAAGIFRGVRCPPSVEKSRRTTDLLRSRMCAATVANTCFRRSRWAGADWCGDQSKAPPPAINSRRAAAQLEADCQAGRCWEAFSYCVSVPDRVFPLRADCPVPPSELAALNEHALAAPLAARIPIGDHERPLAAAGRLYPSMRHSTLTALTRRL